MTKEDILHHFQDINFYYGDCMMYADLSGMLDELIADNKGEWIKGRYRSVDQTGETYDDGEAVICSVCRHAFKEQFLWSRNFCPNCGADMRGE